MRKVKSCGVLVFKQRAKLKFLLMHHADRYDMPKGHVDPGESDLQCALRELEEETGITPEDIDIDPDFRFEIKYRIRSRKFKCAVVQKKLVMYLGFLRRKVPIVLTEHIGHEWVRWDPPHHIQHETIDPLLSAAAAHFSRSKKCG